MSLLEVTSLCVQRDNRVVLSDVSFTLEKGEVLFVLGPNGSGKSTLIDACFGLIRSAEGQVSCSGQRLDDMARLRRPGAMALVGREEADLLGLTVDEVLELVPGIDRAPEWPLCLPGAKDPWLPVEFKDRPVGQLSHGERQRVHLMRGFLQGAAVLFCDEATAHLDLAHREQALAAIAAYALAGHAAVVVVHELELALRYASRVLVLQNGRAVALGTPEATLGRSLLRDVFGLNAEVVRREAALYLKWDG